MHRRQPAAPGRRSPLILSGLLGGILTGGSEHLADPIMSFDPNPISSVYLDHVYETREGARGATGSVGGGCGCN
jgi:hypothetical protein